MDVAALKTWIQELGVQIGHLEIEIKGLKEENELLREDNNSLKMENCTLKKSESESEAPTDQLLESDRDNDDIAGIVEGNQLTTILINSYRTLVNRKRRRIHFESKDNIDDDRIELRVSTQISAEGESTSDVEQRISENGTEFVGIPVQVQPIDAQELVIREEQELFDGVSESEEMDVDSYSSSREEENEIPLDTENVNEVEVQQFTSTDSTACSSTSTHTPSSQKKDGQGHKNQDSNENLKNSSVPVVKNKFETSSIKSTPSTSISTAAQDDEENEVHEVEKILGVRYNKKKGKGQREFLIKWKGWKERNSSWEPEENLDCEDLVNEFMEKPNARNRKKVDERLYYICRQREGRRFMINCHICDECFHGNCIGLTEEQGRALVKKSPWRCQSCTIKSE